jgi:hypothetical protein
LGRTLRGDSHATLFENACLQTRPDKLEDALIGDPLGQATPQPVMTDAVEKFLSVDLHDVAGALLKVGLGLGNHLVSRSSRTQAVAERGTRGVPSPLQPWEHSWLDQPITDTRHPQLAFLLAPWLGYLHPLERLGLLPPLE